jgi:hypothetical protein
MNSKGVSYMELKNAIIKPFVLRRAFLLYSEKL